MESDNGTYQVGIKMWQQPNVPLDVFVEKYEAALVLFGVIHAWLLRF